MNYVLDAVFVLAGLGVLYVVGPHVVAWVKSKVSK